MKVRLIITMMVAALLLATSSLLQDVTAAGVTASGASTSLRQVTAAGVLKLTSGTYALSVDAPAVAPQVSAVAPASGYNYQPTIITISGTNFTGVPTVTLGLNILSDVTLVDSATLSATVAAELPSGSYDLTVTNPDGDSANLAAAFTVLTSVDGLLGPWTPQQEMTTERSYSAAVAVGNFIYVLGGHKYGDPYTLKSVERATVNPDGSLGAWQSMPDMTKTRESLAAVATGGYIYAVGGESRDVHDVERSVERAAINPDGSLGPWQLDRELGSGHRYFAVVAAQGYLYAIAGKEYYGYPSVIERAHINPDGSLDSWEVIDTFPTGLWGHAAVVVGNQLYVLSGMTTDMSGPRYYDQQLTTMRRRTINADGTLGPWQSETSGPGARSYFGAVAANGYLYAIGGYTSYVVSAPIYADGTVGSWQVTAPLSLSRLALSVVVVGKHVYALGGDAPRNSSTKSVESAELNPLAALAFIPQAVQSGQSMTVALTGRNFRATPEITLGITDLAVSFVSSTTLSVEIPAGLADGWYSAVITNPDGSAVTLQNALVVDDIAPAGSITFNNGAAYTASVSATLTLSASDDLSGVDRVAFSDDGVTFGAIQPYTTAIPWPLAPGDGAKTLYAHFIDKAGNVSTAVSDTITLDTTAPDGALAVNGGADYARSLSVTLDVSATDSASGLYQMSFSNNGSSWSAWQAYASSASWTLTAGDGDKMVYARFSDNVGNISTTTSDGIILDTVAPSAHVTALSSYKTTLDFTVSWSGSDASSGIGSYDVQYRDNGGAWMDWQQDNSATSAVFTGVEGHRYDFRARALDGAGNQGSYAASDTQTTIDTLAPTPGAFSINNGALSSSSANVNLSLTATDSTSGVSEVSFSNNGSSWSGWQAYASSASWSLAAGDGNKTVYARYRDHAGNISTLASDSIVLDTSVPTDYGVSINEGDLFTNGVTVTLSIGARPGTAQIKVSNDGGFAGAVWEPYVAHKEWAITQFGSYVIPRVVYVRYGDAGGNVLSTAQDDIILDVTPPTGAVSIASAGTQAKAPVAQPAAVSGMSVRLNLTANDDVSGVGEMMLSNRADLAGASWEPYASSRTWQLDSNNTVYVRFRDNASNVSATYSSGSGIIPFTDVPADAYFYEPVNYLASRGVLSGYSCGATCLEFRPYNNATRGQMVKIIVLAEEIAVSTPVTATFRDVPVDQVFFAFVETAAAHNIVSGYGCGAGCLEFRPYNNVTRGQLVKIIVSAAGWPTIYPPTAHFNDVPTTDPFYDFVETAFGKGIISGYSDATFRPGANATRGQIAKIVWQAVTQ